MTQGWGQPNLSVRRFFTALGQVGLGLYLLMVVAGVWLLSLPAPIASTAVPQTIVSPCPQSANLASPHCGAVLRASSVDYRRSHFVGYLTDAEPNPSIREKWMPQHDDLAPWVEVELAQAQDLGRLELDLGCAKEKPNLLGQWLQVECKDVKGDAVGTVKKVKIDEANFVMPLDCPKTQRLRLRFFCRLGRVYELRVYAKGNSTAAMQQPFKPGLSTSIPALHALGGHRHAGASHEG